MQKKIPLVIGLGITGRSLVNYLASLNEEIIIIEDSISHHFNQFNLTLFRAERINTHGGSIRYFFKVVLISNSKTCDFPYFLIRLFFFFASKYICNSLIYFFMSL